jgi:hypothetical protein
MFPSSCGVKAFGPDDIAAIQALYAWASQRAIDGIGTDSSPALCACGNSLVMAWKGIGDDHRIWVSRSGDGVVWTPQDTVPGAGTSDGPALAWDGSTVWLALRGVPGDDGLYWATSSDLGASWSNVQPIPGTGSTNGPAMTVFNGAPLLAWRGIDDDDGLYWATWNGGTWSGQQNVGGTGSADRPSVCVDFAGLPRMVWRGIEGDDALYTSTLIGQFWQPQQLVEWIIAGNGPAGTVGVGVAGSAVGPSVTPGLTVGGAGTVSLAWQGVPDDDGVYFTQAAAGPGGQPAVEWSTQASIEGTGTSHRPGIAVFGGRIHIVWKGARDDHTIWTTAR